MLLAASVKVIIPVFHPAFIRYFFKYRKQAEFAYLTIIHDIVIGEVQRVDALALVDAGIDLRNQMLIKSGCINRG